MGMTMTQKILAAHAGLDSVKAGQFIEARLDGVLANDITGPVAIKNLAEMGADKVFDKDRVFLIPDHFTPNKDIKAAEQCKVVREFARAQELSNYFEVGKVGIEHALLPEQGLVTAGDVIIGGTAEGVEITAGGQIILKRGIRGMGKGVLKSGGNVVAKFLENTTVNSGGYVMADAIIYSDVSAKGDVIVNSKKGYVNGGTIRSETLIKVKNAGSEMGTKTNMEVGVDPTLLVKYKKLNDKIEETIRRMEVSSKSIELYTRKLHNGEKLPPEKLAQFKMLAMEYKQDSENIVTMQEEFTRLHEEIEKQDGGVIEVGNTVYPGVKIVVVDATAYIREIIKNVRFVRDGADVIARHMH